MLPEEELRKIEDRLNKATPGPWVSSVSETAGGSFIYSESPERAYFYHGEWVAHVAVDNDKNFIVHAIEDMGKIIKEIKRLKGILTEQEEEYNRVVDSYYKKLEM